MPNLNSIRSLKAEKLKAIPVLKNQICHIITQSLTGENISEMCLCKPETQNCLIYNTYM